MEDLQNDLRSGAIPQEEYDRQYAAMQPIRDRLAIWEMKQGELDRQSSALDQYQAELTEAGLSGEALSVHDGQPGLDDGGFGERAEPSAAPPQVEPEMALAPVEATGTEEGRK
jgi:hypothetical protein